MRFSEGLAFGIVVKLPLAGIPNGVAGRGLNLIPLDLSSNTLTTTLRGVSGRKSKIKPRQQISWGHMKNTTLTAPHLLAPSSYRR